MSSEKTVLSADFFARASRHLQRNGEVNHLLSPPETGDITILRGFGDRRARGLGLINQESIDKTIPNDASASAAIMAFLDVYGDIEKHGRADGEVGVNANARAARCFIMDDPLAITGYDGAAAVLAFAFYRSITPDFDARFPEVGAKLDADPELVTRASLKTPNHHFFEKRLEADRDMIKELMDDFNDPDAALHRIAMHFNRPPSHEEALGTEGLLISLDGSWHFLTEGEESRKGFFSIRDLFSEEANTDQDRIEEIQNLERQLAEIRRRVDPQKDKFNKQTSRIIASELRTIYNGKERSKRQNQIHQERKAERQRLFGDDFPTIKDLKKKRDALRRKKGGESAMQRTLSDQKVKLRKKLLSEWEDADESKETENHNEPDRTGKFKLLPPSPNLGDFGYYRVSAGISDHLSRAQDLIAYPEARGILDGLYTQYGQELKKVNREGRKLAAWLQAPRDVHVRTELEEGTFLNPNALSQLIIDPTYDTPYADRRETYGQSLDTAVTILIDNSGSMGHDNKIQLAYLAGERLSYWLTQCGITTEILGFTSIGSADKASREPLSHILYKERHEPHTKRTTWEMAAMLGSFPLRNNYDGEAVAWAHNRLLAAPQSRKLLIVISDGEPAAATQLDLNRHLRDTVAWIEKNSAVEIVGIGVKSDAVEKFYSNHVVINDPSDLMRTMAIKLRESIDSPARSAARQRRALRPVPVV